MRQILLYGGPESGKYILVDDYSTAWKCVEWENRKNMAIMRDEPLPKEPIKTVEHTYLQSLDDPNIFIYQVPVRKGR